MTDIYEQEAQRLVQQGWYAVGGEKGIFIGHAGYFGKINFYCMPAMGPRVHAVMREIQGPIPKSVRDD